MHITRGLLEVLLDYAEEAEPDAYRAALGTTPAGELVTPSETDPDVDPSMPVFTHVYMPSAGRSVEHVFGVDLATPAGRTAGRFVSHPDGHLGIDKTDDLHAVVLVAVPPWTVDDVLAVDRRGNPQPLTIHDAAPRTESLPE